MSTLMVVVLFLLAVELACNAGWPAMSDVEAAPDDEEERQR